MRKSQSPQQASTTLRHALGLQPPRPQLHPSEHRQTGPDKSRVDHATAGSASRAPKRSLQFPEMNTKVCKDSVFATPLAPRELKEKHSEQVCLCRCAALP